MTNRSVWIACLVGLASISSDAQAELPEGAAFPIIVAGQGGTAGTTGAAGTGAPMLPYIYVVDPTIPIPSNGSILLQSDGMEPILEVSQAAGPGALIAGSVRHVTLNYWAWKADEPLAVTEHIVAILNGTGGEATIAVVDAMAIELPVMTSMPELVLAQTITEHHFCRRWTGADLVNDTAFAAKEISQVFIRPHLSTAALPALVHQFLYGAFTGESDLTAYYPFRGDSYEIGPYAAQADEYCFRFDAMDLTMSAIHADPQYSTMCVPHGGLPDLSERASEVPDSALDRFVCQSPPAGLEERWCAINRACQDLAPAARTEGNGCLLYGHTCLNEGLPRAMPPVVGGMTGGSDVDPNPSTGGVGGGDLGTSGMQAMEPETERARLVKSGCGCFVGARPNDSTAHSPLLIAFGLLLVAQRVLRGRA